MSTSFAEEGTDTSERLRAPRIQIVNAPAQHEPARGAEQVWTTRRLLETIRAYLQARGIDSPRLVAEMLLAHVLGCERMRLYMEVDRPAGAEERQRLRELTRRAGAHEPIHFLLGEAPFFWRQFEVDRTTLIPQPSTETLVEAVLEWQRARPEQVPLRIADIGTGSGCIAVSLAASIEHARILATDVRAEILDLARRNAARHGVADRIELHLGPICEPLRQAPGWQPLDVICSNPPYVPDHELETVDPSVRQFVPESAWRGGPDGLSVLGPLIAESGALLRPGGLLALEIAHCQRDAVENLLAGTGDFDPAEARTDHEGLWRVMTATRRG